MAIAEPQVYMDRIVWDDESGNGNDPCDPSAHLYHGLPGLCMVKVAPHGTGHLIQNLWVRPDLRRHGYARAMLEHVLETYGTDHLYVKPEPFDGGPDADVLIKLYASLGFEGPVTGLMYRTGK